MSGSSLTSTTYCRWDDGTGAAPRTLTASGAFSTLGSITAGTTVAAGTPFPAVAGVVTIVTNTATWVHISGTAARQGDAVIVSFDGNRDEFPSTPSFRRLSGSATDGDDAAPLPEGTIEVSVSGSMNPSAKLFWEIVRSPA